MYPLTRTLDGFDEELVTQDGKVALAFCPYCDNDVPLYTANGTPYADYAVCGSVVDGEPCGGQIHLNLCDWTECFMKWGQNDGDGNIYTYDVAEFLESKGWTVGVDSWGLHNTVIHVLIDPSRNCVYRIWSGDESVNYDKSAEEILPPDLIAELDARFLPESFNEKPFTWVTPN